MRRVVLHADDLGMNRCVTDGILYAFEDGLLTSTSLMGNAPDAARALEKWRQLEYLRLDGRLASTARRQCLGDPAQPFDLGIHLNLTQGRPMIGSRYPAELLDANGRFPGVCGLFRRLWNLRHDGNRFTAAIREELSTQVRFMLDRGHHPSHINGHQYIEMLPEIAPLVERLAVEFHIPAVRIAWEKTWRRSFLWPGIGIAPWVVGGLKAIFARRFHARTIGQPVFFPDAFFGTMTAGTTKLPTIEAFLNAARDFEVAEIALHPGEKTREREVSSDGWHDPLAKLRPRELDLLISGELVECLAAHGVCLGRLSRSAALASKAA